MSDPVDKIEELVILAVLLMFGVFAFVLVAGGISALKNLFDGGSNPSGNGAAPGGSAIAQFAAKLAGGPIPGTGVRADPNSEQYKDPVWRMFHTSGDQNTGEWNDGSGQLGNVWQAIKSSFGFTDSPVPESDAQGAQDAGLLPGPNLVTPGQSDADYFNQSA